MMVEMKPHRGGIEMKMAMGTVNLVYAEDGTIENPNCVSGCKTIDGYVGKIQTVMMRPAQLSNNAEVCDGQDNNCNGLQIGNLG